MFFLTRLPSTETLLSEPNQLRIYPILTGLEEEQYPTSALSSLSVSPKVGRMGLRSTSEDHRQRLTERLIIRYALHSPHLMTTSIVLQCNNRIQLKSCTFQTLFKKTSMGKPKYNRDTKTSTQERLLASDPLQLQLAANTAYDVFPHKHRNSH